MRIPRVIPLILGMLVLVFACGFASADTPTSQSTHYGVDEVFFGSGGDLKDCSTNYCSKVSIGEETVGNPTSADYQVHAGFNTTNTPLLQFEVNGGTVDLGTLTQTAVQYGYVTFSVENYVSNGYNVILEGTPPGDPLGGGSTYYMHTLSTPTTETPGTEQFGINLVANTTPPVGAAVSQLPDSTFGFGQPTTNYGQVNKFTFNDGDAIATSSKASGESLFTLSMIANIDDTTPGGLYTGNVNLVAVGNF